MGTPATVDSPGIAGSTGPAPATVPARHFIATKYYQAIHAPVSRGVKRIDTDPTRHGDLVPGPTS